MLKLYLAKINQDLCKHKISLALKKEIKQYQNKNAQLQKIASYLLLNRVLELNNIKSVRIKTNKYGKPYVLGNPIYFNISHNQKNVICGISDKPIGVDIETINPRIKTISKVLLSPNEQKTYIRASNTKLTQIWTLKEATAKLLGTGLTKRLNSLELDNLVIDNKKIFTNSYLHAGAYIAIASYATIKKFPKIVNIKL